MSVATIPAMGEDVLVVYDTSLGFTTGGGHFDWPGTDDKTSFGYTMKYNQKGKKIQGSILLIRHTAPATYGDIYRIKSNALYGLALGTGGNDGEFSWASFSGKTTYQEPEVDGNVGNHEFFAYVEDHGVPGAGKDRFWLEVRNGTGDIVFDLSMEPSAADHDNSQILEGGNIVVPQEPKGKPAP